MRFVMALMKKSIYIAIFAAGIYCLKQYMNGGICTSQARLDNKVVVLTGANTGLGKETAKDLVQRGAKVYLACRSIKRAQEAAEDIQKETGVSADRLPIIHLDLESLKSVRDFVREFQKKEDKLDILINNAGVMLAPQGKTQDGFETTFGVNHLGHFLLTHLLMDALAAAPRSRIINVSARLYHLGTINFDDLMAEKSYSSFYAYCQSKLANILFTRELAKRLDGTGITSYALHPGAVQTELQRYVPFFDNVIVQTLFYYVTWPFFKEQWNGAQTTICCAVDENLVNESGKYYSDCEEQELSKAAQDDAVAQKLWDISVQLVKLDTSEIHSKLK